MEVQALARSMEIAIRALECPFWLNPLSICHVAVGDLWGRRGGAAHTIVVEADMIQNFS